MERNVLVDRLKGYACLLVLFGHVIMGIRLSGVPIPQFFEGVEKFLWSFHVALFLFLSGVVYKETGEWRSKKTKLRFILHKLYNLGVPYVTFSVIYVLINSFVGGANTEFAVSDILYIWKTPVAQYWFLYALFFLFCIYAAFSGVLKNYVITIIALLIGYLFPIFGIPLGSFDVVFYSVLAFGVGSFVNFKKLCRLPDIAKLVVIISHVATAALLIFVGKIEASCFKEFMVLFGIYSSILFISLVEKIRLVAKFLDFVNKYSFQIFLLHTIFTAGIRIVLVRLNVLWWPAHVIVGTLVGLVFSVLAAIIAKKVFPLNFFFFPSKTLKLQKSVKTK